MNPLLLVSAGTSLCLVGGIVAVIASIGTRHPGGPDLASQRRRQPWLRVRGAQAQRRRRILVVGAAAAGLAAWLGSGLPVVGLLVAMTVPGAPWLLRVGSAERQAIIRIEAVGEWARRLKDVCGTGVGLQQALVASATTAPSHIVDDVRDLAVSLQAGASARKALQDFADAVGDPVCDQVVAALILHLSDRGDRLGDVLGSIATAATAEVATRREIDAKRTQSRFAVRFLTVATVAVLGYGAIRPQYMAPYGSPLGQLMMALLGAAFVGILLWVRAMSQPPSVTRLLRPATSGPTR